MGTSSKPAVQALKEASKLHRIVPLLLLARVASTEPHGNQLGHFEANPKLSAASF